MLIEQHTSRQLAVTVAHHPIAQTGRAHIVLGPVVEAIARELGGAVATERIEALLRELLEREFGDARITSFVPIFLHRAACERLRSELPSQPGSRP